MNLNQKKVQSPLTNNFVYVLETNIKDKAILYCSCISTLSKISGKNHRVLSEQENQKSLKNCIDFNGTDCINKC